MASVRLRAAILLVISALVLVSLYWVARRVISTGAARGTANVKYLYVSPSSPAVLPAGYEPLYPISVKHKYGFISRSGKIVIKPQFDEIGEMSEGLLPVAVGIKRDSEAGVPVSNGKWGYLGEDGRYAIKPQFPFAGSFSEGLAPFAPRGARGGYEHRGYQGPMEKGYIDRTGRMVIPPKYLGTVGFSEGVAWVSHDDLCGAINRRGDEVIPFKYDPEGTLGWWFRDGVAFVEEGSYDPEEERYHPRYFVDKQGKRALPDARIDGALFFDHGVCLALAGGLWGLINREGEWVATPRYDSCTIYARGMTEAVRGRPFNETAGRGPDWYNKAWAAYPQASGRYVYTFSEGLAVIGKGGRYGFIDDRGREIIKPQYDDAWFFVEGLARVRIRDKWGYIDKQNNVVIKPQYDDASDFQEGLAYVKVDGNYGFIDKSGKMVIAPRFREVGQFKYGLAPYGSERIVPFGEGTKWGYINRAGKVVWSPTI
jgi:hypothetical protein